VSIVLSGRSLCDELITLTVVSYRMWCVIVCDLGTSWKRRPWPAVGCCAKNKQWDPTVHSTHWLYLLPMYVGLKMV